MGEIIEDIYFGDYNQKILDLADMTSEEWSFKGKNDNSILKNYLQYTYKKLLEEQKIQQKNNYALFNTGLFTDFYEPIFIYLEKNLAGGSQPWYLKSFCTPYELGGLGISEFPERANYFDDPSLLVFDAKCQVNVQYKHILDDPNNQSRIPDSIRQAKNIQTLLKGAIEVMKKKVTANYKIAVPQYYNGTIQLLLPLCLVDEEIPDLALVVTKNTAGNFYQGHTCLTMEMAYNNARLIAKPESNWLRP